MLSMCTGIILSAVKPTKKEEGEGGNGHATYRILVIGRQELKYISKTHRFNLRRQDYPRQPDNVLSKPQSWS